MNSKYIDKIMIENAKNDDDIHYVDKPYYIKVLETICEILENEDFSDEITFTSTKDIDYLIEFDKNHDNLFFSFTNPDKLWDNIKYALGLNQLIMTHYNKKNGFSFLSGHEIIKKQKEFQSNLKKKEYENLCILINNFWKEYDVQKQLIEKGYVYIKDKTIDIPRIGYGSTGYDVFIHDKCQSKIIHIEKDDKLPFKDNTYYKLRELAWKEELDNSFGLDKDLLDKFTNENSFSYEVGLIINGIHKGIFFNKFVITKICPVIKIYL